MSAHEDDGMAYARWVHGETATQAQRSQCIPAAPSPIPVVAAIARHEQTIALLEERVTCLLNRLACVLCEASPSPAGKQSVAEGPRAMSPLLAAIEHGTHSLSQLARRIDGAITRLEV